MFNGGISGSKLELLPGGIVRKWAVPGQEDRLWRQAEKQQEFYWKSYLSSSTTKFNVPEVLEIGPNYFDMTYIRGLSVIDFLNRASKWHLDLLLTVILSFICLTGRICDYKPEIQAKIDSLGVKIDLPAAVLLPSGNNHGDFTLSNFIFSQNLQNIYLIDFLDGYIESPVMDLIKLRQSTHLLWDLFIHNQLGNVKARIALDYLDNNLMDIFDIPYYNSLQKINIYRILPYCKSQKQKNYVESLLEKLC